MKLERTKNGLRNLIWGLLNRFVGIIFPFILRTIFIYTLGSEYLGLNSLFTSILTVLNLAELGFSSAVVYNMYKPIAENDSTTICALMNYYKKVYHVIGVVVATIGILLIPFLDKLTNGDCPNDINLYYIYIIFLANTVVSYFLFAYKNCILTAYQREDIISKINIVFKTLTYIVQAFLLILFKNYYGYILCSLINTVATNIATAYASNKIYPQYKANGKLSVDSRKNIRKNIQGLMVGKICMVSRNSFDNIFLSMFLGLNTVTIYGNYYYIMNAVSGVLVLIMSSIGAGIGNSIATESVEKNYRDYMKFTFMYAWISGWCTVCLLCLFQPFMKIWMGEQLMFPMIDVILLCLYFYSLTMGDVRSQYSAATGLFWENRFYVLAEAITNIVMNYLLGKAFGVHGIIIATWISIFFINFGWGSRIIFQHYFLNYDEKYYYKKQLIYLVNVFFVGISTYIVTSMISINLYIDLLIKGFVCIIVPNLLFYFIYRNSEEFSQSVLFVRESIMPKLRRGDK